MTKPTYRACACCGSGMGPTGGTLVRFKAGTQEAKDDPGSFSYCPTCMAYEFEPEVMERVGLAVPGPSGLPGQANG